ncbi:M14 family metallopeptidase [Actinoplanes sp. N902-109]|uniref:M14 family metallopeptidase n=1 Tax=Actinoplanes sp. (strain N902-109) TaxID=649831 RepID=UPI0003296031|nr:M14 family metallopeptidase [Actinoplanes sp. N902-109]AGL16695.1 carboxypeptidase [Actinoplanes sp. N902-109]
MLVIHRILTAAVALLPLTTGTTAAPERAPEPQGVFRPYGAIAAELRQVAAEHPDIAKVESIGRTVQGRDILAVKVTRAAATTPDGARPGTLYLGAQHAREWITVEMVRRLLDRFVTGYGSDPQTTALVNSTELWFLPVANPDGYDYTFSGAPGARLWRKNLRDNNGDGTIGTGDGVDLNRNAGFRWGWDDEGSSPDPARDTYRGPAPDSEPETVALNAFERRVKPRESVNFHAAAETLMYGPGWQSTTGAPDDVMYRALAGDATGSAVPGSTATRLSDYATSNGDSAGQAINVDGVPMVVDEMASCYTAADSDPADAWSPDDCGSEFEFPDDERLIAAEYRRNLPFALSVAASAADPARPVSVLHRSAPAFTPHPFTTSAAGSGPQTVAVVARKSLGTPVVRYTINGGPVRSASTSPWPGGRVYGGTDNLYYDEYRGRVTGARAGDRVEVWFSASGQDSSHFTYAVTAAPAGDTLVLAAAGSTELTGSLAAAGHPGAQVWDVAARGAPDPLGVLAHYENVLWAVGDQAADTATTLAVRDFANEGGTVLKAGAAAADDDSTGFTRYWLGVDSSFTGTGATAFTGTGALAGTGGPVTGPPAAATLFDAISDTLPAARYPQFATRPAGTYTGLAGPLEPVAGSGMAAVRAADHEYARLTRTVDLTGVTAAQRPELTFALSYDTVGRNAVMFEAHTPGHDDWTTLPDALGATSSDAPPGCDSLLTRHPFLTHYLSLTPDGDDCAPTGSTGTWAGLAGESGGWHRTALDLSRYAGTKVEVSITYVSDVTLLGTGVLADDARLEIGGKPASSTGFETDLGPFAAAGPPPGSAGNTTAWAQSAALRRSAAALTTAYGAVLGFDPAALPADRRAPLLARLLR